MYLFQANVALVLFFLGYQLVFRQLTFYGLNRFFLLFGLLFSVSYPLIDFAGLIRPQDSLISPVPWAFDWKMIAASVVTEPGWNGWEWVLTGFWAGFGLMAMRFLVQLASVYHLHRQSKPALTNGIRFRVVSDDFTPFSFGPTIYLNPARHSSTELGPILRHEQFHVREWHTLDVLLAEGITIFFWFNPVSWFVKWAIKENLEFRVDQRMLEAGMDAKTYQYLLVQIGGTKTDLGTNFTAPILRKRIGMMNRKPSARACKNYYPLLFLVLLTILILPKLESYRVQAATPLAAISGAFSSQSNNLAALDTLAGTANRIREIQRKNKKNGKALREMILFTKNRVGVGMDLHVKMNDDRIEELKILALASPEFTQQRLHKK